MPLFEIDARDGSARAGVLRCARGEVATPAFVPLASNASVRGLAAAEVAELGFQMVLGNTFHLFIDPGADYVREMGGLHELMGWRAPIITDSGGFQVFSMGHGSVSEEIKRRRGPSQSRILAIEEEGVRFRSYTDGSELFMGPETSMEMQADAGLGHRAGLRRVHAVARRQALHAAGHGAHPPVAGPLHAPGTPSTPRRARRSTASSRAACTRTCAPSRPPTWRAPGVDGIAIGGSLGQDKAEMHEVLGVVDAGPARGAPAPPARDRRRGRHPACGGAGNRHASTAPPPPGWPATERRWCPTRERRWRLDLTKAGAAGSREPIAAGCPCPACREHTRGYLHYLSRAKELTAARLITLHNLTFMAELMRGIREAVAGGGLDAYRERVMDGVEPFGLEHEG